MNDIPLVFPPIPIFYLSSTLSLLKKRCVQDAVRPAEQGGQEEQRTAFVKNIPTHVDPAELTKLFAQDGAGGLVDVRLMKDRLTGIPRVKPSPQQSIT